MAWRWVRGDDGGMDTRARTDVPGTNERPAVVVRWRWNRSAASAGSTFQDVTCAAISAASPDRAFSASMQFTTRGAQAIPGIATRCGNGPRLGSRAASCGAP